MQTARQRERYSGSAEDREWYLRENAPAVVDELYRQLDALRHLITKAGTHRRELKLIIRRQAQEIAGLRKRLSELEPKSPPAAP